MIAVLLPPFMKVDLPFDPRKINSPSELYVTLEKSAVSLKIWQFVMLPEMSKIAANGFKILGLLFSNL